MHTSVLERTVNWVTLVSLLVECLLYSVILINSKHTWSREVRRHKLSTTNYCRNGDNLKNSCVQLVLQRAIAKLVVIYLMSPLWDMMCNQFFDVPSDVTAHTEVFNHKFSYSTLNTIEVCRLKWILETLFVCLFHQHN